MPSQIFKNNIPNDVFFELLDSICVKYEKYYILDNDSFKKGVFKNIINHFLETCVQYYHLSKRKYIEKKVTYNSFITVIRQICNFNKIIYTSQIKYDRSSYHIVYYIYHNLN